MACSPEFIEFVCAALAPLGEVRSRKMMGDYVIYVNEKCGFKYHHTNHNIISPLGDKRTEHFYLMTGDRHDCGRLPDD